MATLSVGKTHPFLTRARQFALFFTAILGFWLYCLSKIDSFPVPTQFFVKIFPLWLAVIVGAMLLGNVGYHLCMFTDCADAHAELQQQIKEARRELTARGLKL